MLLHVAVATALALAAPATAKLQSDPAPDMTELGETARVHVIGSVLVIGISRCALVVLVVPLVL